MGSFAKPHAYPNLKQIPKKPTYIRVNKEVKISVGACL